LAIRLLALLSSAFARIGPPQKPPKHSKKALRGIRKLKMYCPTNRPVVYHSLPMVRYVRTRFTSRTAALFVVFLAASVCAGPARAASIILPPEAAQALDKIYDGDPDGAITAAHAIEQAKPDMPLGYLIEAEAQWWKTYCAACEIKWDMVDAWERKKLPQDEAYFALARKAGELAHAQLATSDTAEMHVYAGAAAALEARLFALRGEGRKAAHASVAGRAEFLRALQLDPNEPDATAGLGIYNYFVDSLSGAVKILRFFMGIPGGSKEEGIRQMKIGIEHGVLLKTDTQFYLVRNLRTFDHKYEPALSFAEPLAARHPRNPIFLLLAGNLNAELGRKEEAAKYFRAALVAPAPDPDCAVRVRQVAQSFLVALH